MNSRLLILICGLGLAGVSCATAQVPNKNYAPAQTISAAEERGVEDLPEAKLHLKLARDQLNQGQKLKRNGNEDEAKLKFLRAQVDADYALALLRHNDQRAQTTKVRQKLEKLRGELKSGPEELE